MNPTRRDALKIIAAGVLAPALPKPLDPREARLQAAIASIRKYAKAFGLKEVDGIKVSVAGRDYWLPIFK